MSTASDLPESDDPFEVLGVPRDVDATELRRVYVRLIKRFRPDREPAAFARVRAAYEAAQRQLLWWHAVDGDEDEAPQGEESADEAGPDAITARIASAWRALADGGDAGEVLAGLQDPTGDVRLSLHRFLIADAAGLGSREHLLSALRGGAPVVGWLRYLLDREEIAPLLLDDAFAWRNLRRQDDGLHAPAFARARVHEFLLGGQLERAVEEVLDDAFVHDAEHHPALQWAGREVLSVAAWAGVDAVERLERRYGASLVEDFEFLSPEDHHAAASALREPWERWRRRFGSMEDLRRFLVLAPVLDAEEVTRLAEALAADFLCRVRPYVTCFLAMEELSPELLERFILAASHLNWSERPDEQELDAEGLYALDLKARELYRTYGGEGDEAWFYEQVLRPMLTRLVVETDLAPEAFLKLLGKHPDRGGVVVRHEEQLLADRMLVAVAWCRRLASYDPDED